MKHIVIAGAGHGGLCAAVQLARRGYPVDVYERSARSDMGYDWLDCVCLVDFEINDIPVPPETDYEYPPPIAYRNPNRTHKIRSTIGSSVFMDRKILINHLLDAATEAGAVIHYSSPVLSALTDASGVKGIRVRTQEGREVDVKADLVIDAAGAYSPVRRSLPVSMGIKREIEQKDIFRIHRVYFENTDGTLTDPPYIFDFYHCGRPGMDWTITTPESVDLLIGKFGFAGDLTQEEIDEAIADYRAEYPFLGEKIVRAGKGTYDIPLIRTIPMTVANGYAAIGDSAGMTFPLNGSGIDLSMRAGKMLADTVIEADGVYTRERLWSYQYKYFKKHGLKLVTVYMLRRFFAHVSAKDVDYLVEEGILDEKMIDVSGSGGALSPAQLATIIKKLPGIAGLLPPMISEFRLFPLLSRLEKDMPETYDRDRVREWVKLYDRI